MTCLTTYNSDIVYIYDQWDDIIIYHFYICIGIRRTSLKPMFIQVSVNFNVPCPGTCFKPYRAFFNQHTRS
jgi:hypothetical protein